MELKNYLQTLIHWIWLLGAGSGYIASRLGKPGRSGVHYLFVAGSFFWVLLCMEYIFVI